jgi:hypothetical protein
MSLILIIRIYLLVKFPLEVGIIFVVQFVVQCAYTFQYIIIAIMINVMPMVGFSGLLLTVLACTSNFG